MDKADIQNRLIEIFTQNAQLMNPGGIIPEITSATSPLTDLPDFDSLACVALTVDCCMEFQIEDTKLQSFFVEVDKGNQSKKFLTIEEVADKIAGYIK
jgi:hypothetical protein